MKFVKPKTNETYMITSAPDWPSIAFETDEAGPHTWYWTLSWLTFHKSGMETTEGNKWDAKTAIVNCGGTLTVRAEANKHMVIIAVNIRGANPNSIDVTRYLATKPNSAGFEKILSQESNYQHFNTKPPVNEPVKSFDNGYGMCQLTHPTPTFDQVWNWQLNIDAGLELFEQKRLAAITYLAKHQPYSAEQLKYETVCRWNGGNYHEWDANAAAWVRRANILCDSQTGNIGWDMNDQENKGKTEADLRKRDSGSYSKAPGARAHWKYFGVCYADHVLR
jgi:hypothetical protein